MIINADEITFSQTHQTWKKFLNETPERYELSAGGNNDRVIRLNSDLAKSKSFSYGLDSGETANSGIGADWAQRPVMALRFVEATIL
jgi:hypothetical protein